jgi:hypothetical protein
MVQREENEDAMRAQIRVRISKKKKKTKKRM